jgi:hypothetical protein
VRERERERGEREREREIETDRKNREREGGGEIEKDRKKRERDRKRVKDKKIEWMNELPAQQRWVRELDPNSSWSAAQMDRAEPEWERKTERERERETDRKNREREGRGRDRDRQKEEREGQKESERQKDWMNELPAQQRWVRERDPNSSWSAAQMDRAEPQWERKTEKVREWDIYRRERKPETERRERERERNNQINNQQNKDGSTNRIQILCDEGAQMDHVEPEWERRHKKRERQTERRERERDRQKDERERQWMNYQHNKDGSTDGIWILCDRQRKRIMRNRNERESALLRLPGPAVDQVRDDGSGGDAPLQRQLEGWLRIVPWKNEVGLGY